MFEKLIKEYEDQLSGGLADKKKPSDFERAQLIKGIKVELEHTDDPKVALEIAMDHLTESSDYYDKLEKMEKNSMDTKIKNASTLPRIYYGLHMTEGIAHYKPADGEPYTIFVGENSCKNLDPTYVGKPVYVDHVEEVDLENLHEEADGYVVESFFNKLDGKHWAKFLVTSDRGHEAIRNGWKLSNAYIIKSTGPAGVWHGADYSTEIVMGEYEHLAIVKNPRYAESIILTPEQFKEYNTNKEEELSRLKNSIEDKPTIGDFQMFQIFKKTKLENSNDINFDEMMITLPKSGKDVSFKKLVNMAEEEKKENGDDKVKVGEEEMTVNELKEKYMNMVKKKNEEDEEAKKKKENEEEEEKKKENMSEEEKEKEKKENEEEEEKKKEIENKKKKNSADDAVVAAELALKNAIEGKANFDKISNAQVNYDNKNPVKVETSQDKVERGNSRYGSDS